MVDTMNPGHYIQQLRATAVARKQKLETEKQHKNGIQVGVTNNQSMIQVEEGKLPFNQLPTAANDVQVFPTMQGPLIGCGKLATNGCGIWFDIEKGSVVSGATKNKTKAIIATAGDDLLLAAHLIINRSHGKLLYNLQGWYQ
jgi:hypothetical protein